MSLLNDLSASAKTTIVLKILGFIIYILTSMLTIVKINFDALTVEAVLTINSLSANVQVLSGDQNLLPSTIESSLVTILFLIPSALLLIAFVLLVYNQLKISAVFNFLGLGFLIIYFMNFLVLIQLNNRIIEGVTLTVSYDIGYLFILSAILLLIASSFFKYTKNVPD
ncbi:MAG: hypothetical protein ACW981_14835 [Candidatus Hodarchaeales archaeon]|jgi:hypothetical protein